MSEESKVRQLEMLRLRLDGMTYKQIADIVHVSRQRVQQILCPPKEMRDDVVKKANYKCECCGFPVGFHGHVHHKGNGCQNYHDIENLELLCPSCHRWKHLPLGSQGTPHHHWNCEPEHAPGNLPRKHAKPLRVKLAYITCKRCQHSWVPRTPRIHVCPKCRSPYFDTERIRPKKNENPQDALG